MNYSATPKELLKQIGQIEQMERGKLSVLGEALPLCRSDPLSMR
jgi:hypothetical protein